MTTNNTVAEKAARRKLNLLELANDLAMSVKLAGALDTHVTSFMKYAGIIKPLAHRDF